MVPEVRVLSSLLGFVLLWFPSDTHPRTRPDMFCLFHGKRYALGESWHPYLEPQGLMYCLRCTCSESAHVSCYRLHCPPVHCPQPVTEPQQCCPRCVEPHTPSGLRAPLKSCQYNGTTYQQGDTFTTQELFPSRQTNQCVFCSCSEGQIYCGLMTCPETSCPTPVPVPDSCCHTCKDGSYEKSAEEETLQLYRGVRHSQDPCVSQGGSRRAPGTTAPTGLSSSLGFIPRHFGQKGSGSTTIKIVLKEKHKKEDRTNPSDEVSTTKCPAGPSQVLVHTLVSPSPESLRRIALEQEASDYVEIYIWKLVKGIFHLIQIKKVRKQEFKEEAQNFRLITRTNEGHWNVFRAQAAELKVTASPDKETKTL
ncbi:chordin-like protein 2 isoform X2 [Antechinus flavipes]|uniref:chordin-like protein 2 isoform X2 n=1 Tax=Antechinus flavipes TaxID=38775 RepID=UPI002236AD4D|nr:chordin-like protein 2 isoform X2 [Antechinus flavipes]